MSSRSTRPARAAMLASSVTSSAAARASPPIRSATRRASPSSRAVHQTVSPAAASCRQTSAPRPREAPVTRATRFMPPVWSRSRRAGDRWSLVASPQVRSWLRLTLSVRSVLIGCCRFEVEEREINQSATAATDGPPIIALGHASKSYGAVQAARDVSIALSAGEVRALAGENGAGKSTIVRMLAGVQRPDEGDVLIGGAPVTFHGPADARDAGVAVIYQEPTLFPDLSVAENVMMGRHPLGSLRRIDRKALQRAVQELMDRLGVDLDPEQPVRGLSIADQQIVEIAKALSFDARVLIMDEPTAALSGHEVERLFNVVRTLRTRGAAVLFISHRLDEIFAICDTVTVLRDGQVTHDGTTAG